MCETGIGYASFLNATGAGVVQPHNNIVHAHNNAVQMHIKIVRTHNNACGKLCARIKTSTT
jgi:hypothetical protein